MPDNDLTSVLQQAVIDAGHSRSALLIVGGGSKKFYGRSIAGGIALDVSDHKGIINYQASELVITARAGTRLEDITRTLAEQRQMLAFEPPSFAATATLGGTIACGISGPRRPYTGSARDFVLGCKIINGKGEVLSFGGEVMKNVAGYDVSRLMTGALGTLGVLLEVSLKVLPVPTYESTRFFELSPREAVKAMSDWGVKALPLSGLCYDGKRLYARLCGLEKAVLSSQQVMGGEALADHVGFWRRLREQQLDFFQGPGNLWRLSVPYAAATLNLDGAWFYDWGGALRWLKSEVSADVVFSTAQKAGGHACLFNGTTHGDCVFQPLSENLRQLNLNLKQAFDPWGILNPQRMYVEW